MSDFEDLSIKLGLLEIATLKNYKNSRKKDSSCMITGVYLKNAYGTKLEQISPFNAIKWNEDPFSNFSILKTNPPKPLVEKNGSLEFGEAIQVTDWNTFIDSFRQLRNNIAHGSKLILGIKGMEQRDEKLIKAGLSFIQFLEENCLVQLQ